MALEDLIRKAKSIVFIGVAAASSLVGCKQETPEPAPPPVSHKLAPEIEEMKHYAPLAVGNTWTYLKTVKKAVDVFYLAEMNILKPSKELPARGKQILFTGRPHFTRKFVEHDEEIYTIEEQAGDTWFVSICGKNPRDGRYVDQKQDSKAQWYHNQNRVEELVDCIHKQAEIQNKTILTLLQPGVVVTVGSHHGAPHLSVGASIHKGTITVPAGAFTNCLRNMRMTHSKNLHAVLFHNAVPQYIFEPERKDENMYFGRFMTESFYAEDVGLVKETQYNAVGEKTYTLELKSYNVQ